LNPLRRKAAPLLIPYLFLLILFPSAGWGQEMEKGGGVIEISWEKGAVRLWWDDEAKALEGVIAFEIYQKRGASRYLYAYISINGRFLELRVDIKKKEGKPL